MKEGRWNDVPMPFQRNMENLRSRSIFFEKNKAPTKKKDFW